MPFSKISINDAAMLQMQAHRKLRKIVSDILEEFDLNILNWSILRLIYSNDGINLVKVAKILELEKPIVTNVTKEMEKKTLIKIKRSTKDKRSKNLVMNPLGQLLIAELDKRMNAKFFEIFNDISREDFESYFRVLNKMIGQELY